MHQFYDERKDAINMPGVVNSLEMNQFGPGLLPNAFNAFGTLAHPQLYMGLDFKPNYDDEESGSQLVEMLQQR